MKERPMLFNDAMVRAILNGTKTQTRRVVERKNGQYIPPSPSTDIPGWRQLLRSCPFGQPRDRLWVRECFAIVPRTAYRGCEGVQQVLRPNDDHDAAVFRADWERSAPRPWRPSIHMPRWACRLVLEIVSVRVERLQDISEEDSRAEGASWVDGGEEAGGWTHTGGDETDFLTAKESFRSLWSSVYGEESWNANPWVWVVEFRKVEA